MERTKNSRTLKKHQVVVLKIQNERKTEPGIQRCTTAHSIAAKSTRMRDGKCDRDCVQEIVYYLHGPL